MIILEELEGRRLMSALSWRTAVSAPTFRFQARHGSHPLGDPSPTGYTPAQISQWYGFDKLSALGANGAGQTIAIIDAFDNPKFSSSSNTAAYDISDLYYFNQQFGLPQFGAGGPTFNKVNQSGGTNYPQGNTGWGDEIALDVEWAHALAPMANITLVEASNSSNFNLIQHAANWAVQHSSADVISMSFGSSEFSGESFYDSYLQSPSTRGVTFVASAGDSGAPGLYPAFSPNVVAVGGTTLSIHGNIELAWPGSGGGASAQENRPSYQSSLSIGGSTRLSPDVAFDADPNSGVAIYDSYSQGSTNPWVAIGGTSVSAPCWSGLIAIADQARASAGLGSLNGLNQTLPMLYGLPASDFRDITSGSNGNPAGPGYDMVTGRGTPIANLVVQDLTGLPGTPVLAASSDSGVSNSDRITNVTEPTFTGAAPAASNVQILSDGTLIGSGTAASDGTFSIAATTPLADGPHAITARVGLGSSATPLSITIDTVGPQLIGSQFDTDAGPKLTLQFSEPIPTNLGNASLSVISTSGEAAVPLGTINTLGSTADFYLVGPLPDGNYTATVSTSLTDIAGNPVTGNLTYSFFSLAGDANHDRVVDIQDLYTLASNYGATNATFSMGDFNGDGTVDAADLGILGANWQTTLPPAS